MQALILAAGESSRFWPLNQRHKSQIKVLGKSLVSWTIQSLEEAGIKDVVLVVGPNSSLKEEFPLISHLTQEKALGTGNALSLAKDLIKEPFLVVWPYKINAKEIIDKVLEKYKGEKPKAVLVGRKTSHPHDYGILKTEGERVVEIVENPQAGAEPSDIKVVGAYFLEPDFFDYYQKIEEHHPEDFIDALNNYIKEKATKLVVLEKEPSSLKYPWEVLGILPMMFDSDNFKPSISQTAKIGENVVMEGDVYIGEKVVIGANTVILGPCYIGDNCKIGANNVLRGPVNLEKDVVTGALMEIKNSLVQEGTHFHSGYLGDSVIGKNCRFGAGFIVANRRIDRGNIKSVVKGEKVDTGLTYLGVIVGDNTRFGIHSGTMPGVLIGSDCLIGPGSLVFENLEDNTAFYTKFEGVRKENK